MEQTQEKVEKAELLDQDTEEVKVKDEKVITDNVSVEEEVKVDSEEVETPHADSDDPIKDAMSENEALKAELEALNNLGDGNALEENERLKAEVAEKQRQAEIYKENEALKASLNRIKREQLVEGMILAGKIPKELEAWSETLTIEQLKEFNKYTKARRTIKDEKNIISSSDPDMVNWHQKESRSRIIT
jgi:hypothetical protein